jgi:hypothetical protein
MTVLPSVNRPAAVLTSAPGSTSERLVLASQRLVLASTSITETSTR